MTTPAGTAPAGGRGVTGAAVLRLVPGLLLLAAVGVVGTLAQNGVRSIGEATGTSLPDLEYVLWAIVLGLVIRNTVGIPALFRPGVGTYEFWLKSGIVLLGARFVLGDLAKLGGFSLGLILVDMAVATTVILLVGKAFRLGGKLSSLLAIGTSICGVSAIIAGRGSIDADDEDSGYAIAAILALGAVALFSFPAIGHALDLSDTEFGLWAGLAVDNTAETTATGAAYSPHAQDVAVAVKSTRNALIGLVVLGYAAYWSTRAAGPSRAGSSAALGSCGAPSPSSCSVSSRCPHWRPRTCSPRRKSPTSAICPNGPFCCASPGSASTSTSGRWHAAGCGRSWSPRSAWSWSRPVRSGWCC